MKEKLQFIELNEDKSPKNRDITYSSYEKFENAGMLINNETVVTDFDGDNKNESKILGYLEKENEIRNVLSEMPSSEEIKKLLVIVDLNINEFYAFYGEEKIKNAVLYAKDLKDRYTVLWMNYDFFGRNI